MAKQKRRQPRPFNREALAEHVQPVLRPRLGHGETLWRYTVTVPIEEIVPQKRPKATIDHLMNLRQMFVDHFAGVTRLPNSPGYGLRDPSHPELMPEMNYNTYFVVLVSPLAEADTYFRALRDELEDALVEGVILIERQEIWIP